MANITIENDAVFACAKGSVAFDEAGRLCSIESPEMRLDCAGAAADVGADGEYLAGSLRFQSFQDFKTWQLPEIRLADTDPAAAEFQGFEERDGALCLQYRLGPLLVTLRCREEQGYPALDLLMQNRGDKALWINGTALDLALRVGAPGQVSFDFPGNVPYGAYRMHTLEAGKPVETGLVNAVTHIKIGEGHANLIYINEDEKWSTAVYRKDDGMLHWTALAATEMLLPPGERYRCGSLYLQLVGEGDYFAPIRGFYRDMGWRIPEDGVKDTIVYSCHPSGTMDTRFPLKQTLAEFGRHLPDLEKMGVDTVWLLPVFDHYEADDRMRDVYLPTDQAKIDPRYGTDADMKAYVDRAARHGIRVIFDYVPHGPRPWDQLAVEKRAEWAAVDQNGEYQVEWTCLSFDMANPGYLQYSYDLVRDHIDRFGIGGTRIDCAMGGLSNWKPYGENRPSNSNMKGGVGMSRVMRRAFTDKGVTPFVTPENFHPIPLYNSCTDAYYDMALYRILHDLNKAGLKRKDYVYELTRWLDHQLRSTPEGMVKMRFLGNHDTVSWVWDEKRATDIYGTERAKAMWVLISLIDGCPMIYQGDECPEYYLNPEGPVLEDFFAELFAAKKRHATHEYRTEYIYTGTGIFAFRRARPGDEKLVLVNLDDTALTYTLPGPAQKLYGTAAVDGDRVTLESCGYILLQL